MLKLYFLSAWIVGDYHHYCDYHSLGSCCVCCSWACSSSFLACLSQVIVQMYYSFFPSLATLMIFMQVCVRFVSLVFQCGRLSPGTDAESLLGKHRLERGSAQKAFYQLAAWHWACTREDERWSTCARAHPHTNAHPHIYIIKSCVFLRRWIHFQTFRTLTMHSETILQNSVWNSEELLIYLLQMKEFLPKVFTLLVFLYHVFIKGSCTTTLTWKKTVWMFWWCVFLITRRCQIYKKTFSVSKVELL